MISQTKSAALILKSVWGFIRSFFWTSYENLAMLMGLGGLAAMCILGLPVMFFFSCLPKGQRSLLGRMAIALGFKVYLRYLRIFCFVRLEAADLRSIENKRPLIIVANHPSLLDAVMLLSWLPYGVCVMKAAVSKNILFGAAARVSGYITNESPKSLVQHACDALETGSQLLIFPESTRTTLFPVNPFAKTAAMIAARSGVSIQTVQIEFSTPYLGKIWPLFRRPSLPLRISVKLGEKFDPESDISALTAKIETYYRHLLRE